jgi:hypothetical protein
MKKNYIPSAILEKIKNDVKSINYSDNNEVSNNLLQNSVEPQSLQSLSNHNDSFCPILNSPNTIQTDIHNLDLSYNDIHVINQNFYYHQNFKEQIEDEFNRTLNKFETSRVVFKVIKKSNNIFRRLIISLICLHTFHHI